uniref:hypothetical protein n=1 Tax=Alistipes putredinis TaxID=28117 RepID=UPI003FD73DF6
SQMITFHEHKGSIERIKKKVYKSFDYGRSKFSVIQKRTMIVRALFFGGAFFCHAIERKQE